MPNPLESFAKNMKLITSHISKDTMKAIGATNGKPVSERTLQFDCTPKADGTNRIKVTLTENGTLQVRGFKVEETDLLYSVEPAGLATALKNIGNTVLPTTPTIY